MSPNFQTKMQPDECLMLLSGTGKVLWAGTPAEGFLGYRREELMEMDASQTRCRPGAARGFLAPVAQALRAAATGTLEEAEGDAAFRGRNGVEAALHWRLAVLPSAAGSPELLLTLSGESPSSLELPPTNETGTGFEHALEGIFRCGFDGALTEVNPVFAKMFGHDSPGEMIGAVSNVGCELAADPERWSKILQVIEIEGSVDGFELEMLKADETVFWVTLNASVVRDGPGRPLRMEGRVIDITRQKRAEQESERSRRQLRELTARLDEVREEERASIARELHDELGKSLTLLTLDLAWLRGRLEKTIPGEIQAPLAEKITKMEQTIKITLDTLRRILSSLRPPLLDELGLKDAIEFEMQEFSRRMGIRFDLRAAPVIVASDRIRTAVFRIFQEILTNVARHARASRVKVALSKVDSVMVLVVEDNGCGLSEESLARSRGFGILGIQERARGIGGEVEFNGRPGSGTKVILRVPLGVGQFAGDANAAVLENVPKPPDLVGQPEENSGEVPQTVFEFDESDPRRR